MKVKTLLTHPKDWTGSSFCVIQKWMLCTCTFLVSEMSLVSHETSSCLLIYELVSHCVTCCLMVSLGILWCLNAGVSYISHGISWCWVSRYVNIVRYHQPVNLSCSLIPRQRELGNEAASVCTHMQWATDTSTCLHEHLKNGLWKYNTCSESFKNGICPLLEKLKTIFRTIPI